MSSKLLLVFLLIPFSSLANIDSSSSSALIEKLQGKKKAFKSKDRESRKIKSLMYETAKKLEKLSDQEKDIQEKISIATAKVSERLSGLKRKRDFIHEEHRKISKRFRLLSVWYRSGVGDLLFSSKSIRQLDKRMYYLRQAISMDADRLGRYSQDVKYFDKQKKELKIKIAKMKRMRKKLTHKQSQLNLVKKVHKNILAKVYREKRSAYKEFLEFKKRNIKEIALSSFSSNSFFELKGRLSLPVNGYLRQEFGVISKERRRVSLYSNGIEIQVHKKENVSAVASGKVVHIEENMRGYGNTMVVDHEDRYYTVYSNLSKIEVDLGDSVKEKDVIAKVGGSEIQDRNYLHFEIRKFSEALNPNSWIEKKQLRISKSNNDSNAAM